MPDAETFSDLLEGLDDSFDTMQIPQIKGNWLPKKEVRAIEKLGIYIPTPWEMEWRSTPDLPIDTPLPFMASATVSHSKWDTAARVHPRFLFAIKEPGLPPQVERIPGTVYRFGYCVQLHEQSDDPGSAPRLFWQYAWMVVGKDGVIHCPSELRPVTRQITHRRGGKSFLHLRQWTIPSMMIGEEPVNQDKYYTLTLCMFRQLILWWNGRGERWSVGVRRDDKRVTFSIAPNHTSAYFVDRDRQVTVNGRTKKIIHYVREFRRSNGTVVKEHIRGLREFDWRGFHCAVVAPRLGGFVATTVPMSPEFEDEMPEGARTINTEEAADRLAHAEDLSVRGQRAVERAVRGFID